MEKFRGRRRFHFGDGCRKVNSGQVLVISVQ
jgi:hypothetical protein